jgi:hypothetical protein
MKSIILCADDYGQNTSISQAIITLFEKNRLSATSCMTNSYYWPTHAKWLLPFQDQADIGLHFNLTEGKPLTDEMGSEFDSHTDLLMKAYLRQLNKAAIEAEFNAQIDQFMSAFGREPDFIDGHQHIHQLPVIRDIVVDIFNQRLKKTNAYVRSVYNPNLVKQFKTSGFIKKVIIQMTGASGLRKLLSQNNIHFNTSFSGIYDFSQARDYFRYFPQFLDEIGNKGVIMCHPGLKESSQDDVIAKSRQYEFDYLLTDKFLEECEKRQIVLKRFNAK